MEYFIWQPSRGYKFVRIASPPRDRTGEELTLYDGVHVSSDISITFEVEKVKVIPDFLYDVGLLCLISERAWSILSEFNVSGVKPFPVDLLDPKGETLGKFVWLNFVEEVDLMDRERSSIEEKGYRPWIHRFEVLDRNQGGLDLFLEPNTTWRIFSDRLVARIKKEKLSGVLFRPLKGASRF